MFRVFCRSFTIYSGVHKIKVMHMTYPQAVDNPGGNYGFAGKSCCFPRFLKQKHLFSVDNPVHTVYTQGKNKNS